MDVTQDKRTGRARAGIERRVNLVQQVAGALRRSILSGAAPVGSRLPSEASLTGEYGVSRTVVREAVASLRADGLVEARQGSGVYVLAKEPAAIQPFTSVDPTRISSVIELLELRAAVEIEAAGLASQRRSPAQEEAVIEGCEAIERLIETGEATTDADFALHLTIADATNNLRFREFLEMLGTRLIPRRALQDGHRETTPPDYLQQIQNEHRMIAEAISTRDETAARDAMRQHLKGSQSRYRRLLRQL
ncbi:FadR/GntR family transcriptional regulator [Mangrovibrevibacter kandeliae]|uniref:FadR/GntR family transcriptional regulator n=1 Tax=Mangrovibrevibacter kandeliae TaxID=2968473 RepID=UPI0035590F4F